MNQCFMSIFMDVRGRVGAYSYSRCPMRSSSGGGSYFHGIRYLGRFGPHQ